MINCPNCGKQIADDSAHCGYCGAEIKQEKAKKKTMFGMAALGGDELKKAVEEAKEAKKTKGDGGGSGGGLKLPKPGQKSGPSQSDSPKQSGGGGGLKLPKPGQKKPTPNEAPDEDAAGMAKTERIDLSEASSPSESATEPHDVEERFANQQQLTPEDADPDAPANAETMAMAAPGPDEMGGADFQTDDAGPTAPDASQPPVSEPDEPEPADPGAPFGEPPGPGEPAGPQDFGGAAAATPGPSQASNAGDQGGPIAADAQPSAGPAPGPGAPAGPNLAEQQGGFGQQQIDTGQPPAAQEKSKKGLIIAVVVVAMLLGGGCMLGVGWWVWSSFFAG